MDIRARPRPTSTTYRIESQRERRDGRTIIATTSNIGNVIGATPSRPCQPAFLPCGCAETRWRFGVDVLTSRPAGGRRGAPNAMSEPNAPRGDATREVENEILCATPHRRRRGVCFLSRSGNRRPWTTRQQQGRRSPPAARRASPRSVRCRPAMPTYPGCTRARGARPWG